MSEDDPPLRQGGVPTQPLASGRSSVSTSGVRISYVVHGNGPVIVAHAGGPGTDAAYLRMPEVEKFATVVYIDPVGTGQSDRLPGGDYSMTTYARLANSFIESLSCGPVFFLGHSHGGMVALQLALDHPENLKGVIVYDGAASNAELVEEATARMESFAQRYPNHPVARDARAAWDEAVAQEAGETRTERDRLQIAQRLLPAYLAHFTDNERLLRLMIAERRIYVDPDRLPQPSWTVRSRLADIKPPVAVFVGRYDFICGPRAAATVWQDLPGARLFTFDDSGHFAHAEEPHRFAAAVRSFIRR